jgi:hypothetical protein
MSSIHAALDGEHYYVMSSLDFAAYDDMMSRFAERIPYVAGWKFHRSRQVDFLYVVQNTTGIDELCYVCYGKKPCEQWLRILSFRYTWRRWPSPATLDIPHARPRPHSTDTRLDRVAPRIVPIDEARAARTLGLPWPCTRDDVVTAFRVAALSAHPDRGGRAEDMIRVVEARNRLMDLLTDS